MPRSNSTASQRLGVCLWSPESHAYQGSRGATALRYSPLRRDGWHLPIVWRDVPRLQPTEI